MNRRRRQKYSEDERLKFLENSVMLIVRLQKPGNAKSSHWSKFQLGRLWNLEEKTLQGKFFKRRELEFWFSKTLSQFLAMFHKAIKGTKRRKMKTHQTIHLPKVKRSTEWTRFDQLYLGKIYSRANMQLGKFSSFQI